ncbi:MAG TPA: 16S rRNA (adenine(1518)-N(6)/adenine(1519)-N(6))-dimethyltransferase RsmA [Bacillota bacterium]|nr:16S rRNA (adenine(1518)-N(6)/adenine(1519)-N(6))-dimethyltransferase RsmA [Bacillota bacterium]
MKSLTSPRQLKELLDRHGFHFRKSLGQNFLIDENILNKIVDGAGISKEDFVLEVGPGAGTLTRALASRAKKVAAVEIDNRLISILSETLGGYNNVELIQADILKLDIKELVDNVFDGQSFKLVANLPYYITTPIIMRFLEEGHPFETMVVMLQREVAERMMAASGSKEYGALSIGVQFYTKPRLITRVPASVFMPPPKVGSIVLALDKRVEPAVRVKDRGAFFSLVKAVFSQRRKTLLNTIYASKISDMEKDDLRLRLKELGIDPQRRGETLSLEELSKMSNKLL